MSAPTREQLEDVAESADAFAREAWAPDSPCGKAAAAIRALLNDYRARGEALRDLLKRNRLEDGVALDYGVEARIADALKGAGDEP